jgi:hypothetical protein
MATRKEMVQVERWQLSNLQPICCNAHQIHPDTFEAFAYLIKLP